MSQPTAYTRHQDFSNWQTSNPKSHIDGADLDAEFDKLKVTIDETLVNLAILQRDDTLLGNSTVHANAFTASAILLMAGSWVPKGDWVTATAYVISDVVEETNTVYVCVEAHTSGTFATDLAANKWLKFGEVASAITFAPDEGIVATDIQAAIVEVLVRLRGRLQILQDDIDTRLLKTALPIVGTAAGLNLTQAELDSFKVATALANFHHG